MDISRRLNEFVTQGKDLYHDLSTAEGESLTKTELVMLQVQLNILHIEATRLIQLDYLRSMRKELEAAGQKAEPPPPLDWAT